MKCCICMLFTFAQVCVKGSPITGNSLYFLHSFFVAFKKRVWYLFIAYEAKEDLVCLEFVPYPVRNQCLEIVVPTLCVLHAASGMSIFRKLM